MSGVDLITAERERQIGVHGWTPGHDTEHSYGELAAAASAYIGVTQEGFGPKEFVPICWPWNADYWKPSDDPLRNLVKAGALIAAEIDRLLAERLVEGGEVSDGE